MASRINFKVVFGSSERSYCTPNNLKNNVGMLNAQCPFDILKKIHITFTDI